MILPSSPDAKDGHRAILPQAKPQQARQGEVRASLPAEGYDDRPPRPGMEHRHNLYTDAEGIPVPVCHHRCVQPLYCGLGVVVIR